MIEAKEVQKSLVILEKDPENINANYLLSVYLTQNNKLDQVFPFISKVIQSQKPLKGSFLILAKYYQEHKKKYIKAIQLYKKELELHPKSVPALINLAKLLAYTGQIKDSLTYYKKVIELDPKDKLSYDSLLFFAPYAPETSDQEILKYAELYKNNVFEFTANKNFKDFNLNPNRTRLKLGFVSGDFKRHSVIFFIKNLFNYLSESFDIYCYCNNSHDTMTAELMKENLIWRDVLDLNTNEAFDLIQEDKIDVLIDLSGNTGKNRLDIFAKRPCPMQVSWLGQTGPFGIDEMDYFISNSDLIFEGEEVNYLEKPLLLDTVYAPFTVPSEELEIGETPCIKNNYVTFGSFNNFLKINELTLKTWAKILNKVEKSKLFLKSEFFQDSEFKEMIENIFIKEGIEKERLILENYSSKKKDYMLEYNRVDIALDPFPIGGGTTTHDLLYMGTPLITLNGIRMSQRLSSSMLKAISCKELVAQDREDYINLAVELAGNYSRISDYKKNLRNKYLNSELCDKKNFAVKFSNAIKKAWQENMEVNTNAS